MRRKQGSLVPLETKILSTAAVLRDEGVKEFYGFQIAKTMGMDSGIYYGTIYRALKRLQDMGLVNSRWEEQPLDCSRPRRRLYWL